MDAIWEGLRPPRIAIDPPLLQQPVQAPCEQRPAGLPPGQPLQIGRCGQAALEARFGELGVGLAEVVALELPVPGHLAGQQATAERSLGSLRQAAALAAGLHVRLDAALEDVMRRLA